MTLLAIEPREMKQICEETLAFPCLLYHYSYQPRNENHLSVHPLINGQRNCDAYLPRILRSHKKGEVLSRAATQLELEVGMVSGIS